MRLTRIRLTGSAADDGPAATVSAVSLEPNDDPGRLRASDADRERVAQVLHTAMAEGRIDVAELQDRIGVVYAAKTLGELEPLTADLPVSATPARPTAKGESGSGSSVAVMSETTRRGAWIVPPQHTSVAVMGSVVLDLRAARFTAGHATITATAVMGSIEIVVDQSVDVDVTGVGFLGQFQDNSRVEGQELAVPGAPRVTVRGLALMGSVEVRQAK